MLRRRAGFSSARKVAERLGVPPTRIYLFERHGARESQLRLTDAIELSRLYQCPLSELLDSDLAEKVVFADKDDRPSERLGILENQLIQLFRAMPPASRFQLYVDFVNRYNHPSIVYREAELERRVLDEMQELLNEGQFSSIPNGEAILSELTKEFENKNPALKADDGADKESPKPRRRRPRRKKT